MSYKIAVASGKGGTGKTTVAVNLFRLLNKQMKLNVQLLDCDVEEPNDLIFFPDLKSYEKKIVNLPVPKIDIDNCNFCKKCVEYCEFNAISMIPSIKHAEVDKTLCHSCGACSVACNQNAIVEYDEPIGVVSSFADSDTAQILEGRLKIGSAMQTALIKVLKRDLDKNADVVLLDAPPGTSCPVVETVCDADFVILVAEPTLFGFHDFKLMIALLKELDIPYGVVVNKSGLGDTKLYDYIKEENIDLIGEIPFLTSYAEAYSKGEMLEFIPDEIKNAYNDIAGFLVSKFNGLKNEKVVLNQHSV